MKTPVWLAFAMLLSSCSLLNEDAELLLDCAADPSATDCQGGERLSCDAAGEPVLVACADTLTCEKFLVGMVETAVCAPDCEAGSTSKVCDGNRLLECDGMDVNVMDCGVLTCTVVAGMGAECQ